ncbi:MAG TPA: PAS domain S-box protein [Pyrinomonadaceae bacterium]|jgi:PAS domain S-box-containing protein
MKTVSISPTVLVVNDDPAVLEVLSIMLEREGYKIFAANGGRQALEIAGAVTPDIIISDVVMPEMDGLELCRRLKLNTRTSSAPVLLVSAVRQTGKDNLAGLAAGADDYLSVPFRRQELLVKVARLTERHRVEKHYRELVEQAADIIFTRDLEGRITSINEAGVRFFGRPVSELVGIHLSELLDQNVAAEMITATSEHDSGEPMRWVRCLNDAEGVARYLEGVITLMRDAQGQVLGVRGVVRDITERKHAERAIRESEERYRALVEQSNDGIILFEAETKRILEANPALRNLLGYSPEEISALTIYDLVTTDREIVDRNIGYVLEHGHHIVGERKYRRKDGSLVDVEIAASRISYGGQEVLCTTVRDITERKRVREELETSAAEMRESEERYRAFVENSSEAIWRIEIEPPLSIELSEDEQIEHFHHQGYLAECNDAMARMYGYTRAHEIKGRKLCELIDISNADNIASFRAFIRAGYRLTDSESVERDRYGNQIFFLNNLNGIIEDGHLTRAWGIQRDITEQKRAAEALKQQAEREALANRISSAVRRSLDAGEVFRTAVREIGMHLNVDRCSLFMLDEGAGVARNVAEYHAQGVRAAGRDYPFSLVTDLVAGLRQNGVLAFDDVAHDERISHVYDSILSKVGVRSVMYAAIKVGEEIPACFAISTTRSHRQWSEKDIELARAVAVQTGIAIRQAELYQKAAATSAREALINRLSLAIRASLSLPEVLSTATRELGRALAASRAHLYMYDPAQPESLPQHEYVSPHASSIKHVPANFDGHIGQRLLLSSQPLVIDDALNYSSNSQRFDADVRSHASRVGLRSQINCPLIVNGQFRGVLCIHQTDRVRRWTDDEVALVQSVAAQLAIGIAQAELFEMTRRAKKEWETTFDAMSDGIFIFDKNGRLIRVNRAGAALEESWPHLLVGRHCSDILHVYNEGPSVVEQTISEGRGMTVEITPERYNRPLLVSIEPIFESVGKAVGAVCTARDLSELRKMEAVARERQSLLTNILESVRDPICALDTEGNFLWINTASTATSGYRAEDLIGHHFTEMLHAADREMAAENFQRALEGEPRSYEVRYLTTGGELRDALYHHAPLVVDGRTTGVLGIARDITEHKQQQKRAAQAEKLRALGQLASGVAHDFNNALAAILGRAQLMRRQVESTAAVHNLDIIQTAAEDAASTVRRIQTFARQSQEEEFERLDATLLLHDAVEITRTRWENEARIRGLFYDVSVEAGPSPLYVSGNASELREVFVNLIVNALDAMPFGGRLLISAEQRGERASLSFKDTGTGMPEEVRERIFEPFYTTKGANGTGLGLAVSYSIIERHAGQINVTSELGAGTTFELDLPAVLPLSASLDPELERASTPALEVLVIDDEEFVRETLADMLEALDHRVTKAAGGREALETLARQSFDLVFTDLSMPGMDGWELAREIRRRWPELSLVLVTGYGKGAEAQNGDRDLFNGIIGKPFDFTQVTETIAHATLKIVMSDD